MAVSPAGRTHSQTKRGAADGTAAAAETATDTPMESCHLHVDEGSGSGSGNSSSSSDGVGSAAVECRALDGEPFRAAGSPSWHASAAPAAAAAAGGGPAAAATAAASGAVPEPLTTRLAVAFRGQQHHVRVAATATLADLSHTLFAQLGAVPDTQKLMIRHGGSGVNRGGASSGFTAAAAAAGVGKKGGVLRLDNGEVRSLTLVAAGITEDCSLVLLASTQSELTQHRSNQRGADSSASPTPGQDVGRPARTVPPSPPSPSRLLGFEEEEKREQQRRLDAGAGSSKRVLEAPTTSLRNPYGFGGFVALQPSALIPQVTPPPEEALQLMYSLATDRGIVAIMNKYKWRVGVMTELPPVGLVGISPQCLLGFNRNRGEEISLRLRTDDMKGFRKIDSIRRTLLHELAHMVHDEHDDKFKAFNSQLTSECVALDWTKSTTGRVLGSATTALYQHVDFRSTPAAAAGGSGPGTSAALAAPSAAKSAAADGRSQSSAARVAAAAAAARAKASSASVVTATAMAVATPSAAVTSAAVPARSATVAAEAPSPSALPAASPSSSSGDQWRHPTPPPAHTAQLPARGQTHDRQAEDVAAQRHPSAAGGAVAGARELQGLEAETSMDVDSVGGVAMPSEYQTAPAAKAGSLASAAGAEAEAEAEGPGGSSMAGESVRSMSPHSNAALRRPPVHGQHHHLLDQQQQQHHEQQHHHEQQQQQQQQQHHHHHHHEQQQQQQQAAQEARQSPLSETGQTQRTSSTAMTDTDAAPAAVAAASTEVPSELDVVVDSTRDVRARMQAALDQLLLEATHATTGQRQRMLGPDGIGTGVDTATVGACTDKGQEDVVKTLNTLEKMLRNVLQHPSEAKFRRIRLTNRLFSSTVAKFSGAMALLRAVGFEEQWSVEEGCAVLQLRRSDPGLLWLACECVSHAQLLHCKQ